MVNEICKGSIYKKHGCYAGAAEPESKQTKIMCNKLQTSRNMQCAMTGCWHMQQGQDVTPPNRETHAQEGSL